MDSKTRPHWLPVFVQTLIAKNEPSLRHLYSAKMFTRFPKFIQNSSKETENVYNKNNITKRT